MPKFKVPRKEFMCMFYRYVFLAVHWLVSCLRMFLRARLFVLTHNAYESRKLILIWTDTTLDHSQTAWPFRLPLFPGEKLSQAQGIALRPTLDYGRWLVFANIQLSSLQSPSPFQHVPFGTGSKSSFVKRYCDSHQQLRSPRYPIVWTYPMR